MTTFSLVGTTEPFLHVAMRRGDKIFCESNAMVMMEDTLELKGRLQGGLAQSLLRRFANDAFVAATHGVDVKVKMNSSIGGALFGDNGGFLVMHTGGEGQLVVSGAGSLFELEVTAGKDVIVDNGHVVCWDSQLQYELSMSTAQNSGFLGNLLNSATSGEGMVLRFRGHGRIVVCSRNRQNTVTWLHSKLGGS